MKRGEFLCRCIWVPQERQVYGIWERDFKPQNQALALALPPSLPASPPLLHGPGPGCARARHMA